MTYLPCQGSVNDQILYDCAAEHAIPVIVSDKLHHHENH